MPGVGGGCPGPVDLYQGTLGSLVSL